MLRKTKTLTLVLAMALLPVGCSTEADRGHERWATTENTNVAIDWDKVNEAYKAASGPEDLERRINEIYTGDEVISVAVVDLDARVQEVTGFFDKNESGKVDEGEKIFTIKREVVGDGAGQMQTTGFGPYAGYHSPVMSLVTGMLLGSMMSRAFMPGYAPMYGTPYVTSPGRRGELRSARPSASKPSTTGRSYNSRPSAPRGGGRFGVRRVGRRALPVRLTA